ncbi:MAG: hypothetical protein AB1488_01435 [Nitrospirota bacterium]
MQKDCREIKITDEDIRAAFKKIKTYIDITENDFKLLYKLALEHARERQFSDSMQKI